MVVDRRLNWLDHSPTHQEVAMAWYDRFGKYRNAAELRWIVLMLAAVF